MFHVLYPHLLKVEKQNTDWDDPASADFIVYGECEDQPNDAGRNISNKDGQSIAFKSVIFTPANLPIIPIGAQIQVFEQDGTLRLSGTVSRFSHGLFRNRIWVA